jgi:hypothetical protein
MCDFQHAIVAPEPLSYCLCRQFERAPVVRIASRCYCARRAGIDGRRALA